MARSAPGPAHHWRFDTAAAADILQHRIKLLCVGNRSSTESEKGLSYLPFNCWFFGAAVGRDRETTIAGVVKITSHPRKLLTDINALLASARSLSENMSTSLDGPEEEP